MFKKLDIEKKYRDIAILVVIVGVVLFLANILINSGSVIIGVIFKTIQKFIGVISPIIAAIILAYVLYVPVIRLQGALTILFSKINKKVDTKKSYKGFRILSISLVFILIIAFTIAIITFIIPPITKSISLMLDGLPHFQQQLQDTIEFIQTKLSQLSFLEQSHTNEFVGNLMSILTNMGNGLLLFIKNGISGIGSFVVDFVLTLILTFYFLKDKEMIFKVLNHFVEVVFPKKAVEHIKGFISDLDDVVGKFIVGAIFDAFIVGIVSSVLLLIINHPFAILVGVIAGITNLIPYIGPLIGALLALFLGMFNGIGFGVVSFCLLIAYQQIDGNIVQPKIVGGKVGLAPVWILISILIGGKYFGAAGMILAVPVAGIITVYFKRFAASRKAELQK